jgi:hypothetical protein
MAAAGTEAIVRNTTSNLDVETVREMWLSELHTHEIASQLNVTAAALQYFTRKHQFPKRPSKSHKSNASVVDPTPEEISARAAEIRAKRTEQEEARMYRYARVEIRQYSYNGRAHAFAEM